MNKIVVKNDQIELLETDDLIVVSLAGDELNQAVTNLNIKIKQNTTIDIDYDNNTKLNVKIEVLENVEAVINEIKKEENTKVQNKYYLEKNSTLTINKFCDSLKTNELDIICLKGEKASINYNFKVISKDTNIYNIMVYHFNHNTNSNIINKGVSILNGDLTFNVTSIVYKGIKGCNVSQNNRIINTNDNLSRINPVLLIDEEDVSANHSAYIGKFKEDDIFYLQSRGITKEDAINLLIRGFLHDNNEEVNKIIDEYWG